MRNGLTIQYFTASLGSSYKTVEKTFPISFASQCVFLTANAFSNGESDAFSLNIKTSSLTKTGFKGVLTYGRGIASESACFLAIGY